MINFRAGEVYTAESVSSGKSEYYGEWEQVTIRDPKAKTKKAGQGLMLPIFAENRPTGIKAGDTFRVKEITNVQVMLRPRANKGGGDKYDRTGQKIIDKNVKTYAIIEKVSDAPIEDLFSADEEDDIFDEKEETEKEVPFWLK